MKRKNDKIQEQLNALRTELEPLDKSITLPDEIDAQSIAAAVEGTAQKKSRRGKIIALRTVGSLAAALAIAVGVGAVVRQYRTPRVKELPEFIASAETPVSGNDKSTFVNYFTALRSEYEKQSEYNFFHSSDKKNDTTAEIGETAQGNAAAEHGETNNQVGGVEEDDIVKNDGRYLYILTDNSLKIVDTAGLKLLSKTKISLGESGWATGIYIKDNCTAVICSDYSSDNSKTIVRIFDTTDKTAPKQVKSLEQDGDCFTTRLIGSQLCIVSHYDIYVGGIAIKNGYADYNKIVPATAVDGGAAAPLEPDSITILPQQSNRSSSYLVLSCIDLDSLTSSQPKTSAVLGAGSNAYCSTEALFVASTEYDDLQTPVYHGGYYAIADIERTSLNCKTHIYKFSFKSGYIALECDGTVDGSALNQFSMDEKDGYFRIATTSADDNGESINLLTVLDSSLKTVGKVEGFAKGETIRSVRYIGNYGYVVTFEQTDPLFVIDLSSPTDPKIVGEVKLPGFSSYLHPFNGYLVGIGTDGDENGTTNALKVSLFDISNPAAPKEIDKLVLKNAYCYAGYDHKTVMDYATKSILGFPCTQDSYGANGRYITTAFKFITIKVENGKLSMLNSYVNYSDEEFEKLASKDYSSPEGNILVDYSSMNAIRRGTYIGTTLYTCSDGRVCVWPVEGGECTAKLDY